METYYYDRTNIFHQPMSYIVYYFNGIKKCVAQYYYKRVIILKSYRFIVLIRYDNTFPYDNYYKLH